MNLQQKENIKERMRPSHSSPLPQAPVVPVVIVPQNDESTPIARKPNIKLPKLNTVFHDDFSSY